MRIKSEKNQGENGKLLGTGLVSAVAASLCCITPVLALISGTSGIASTFSWMEPLRPYLIGITLLVLAFAWYQKLKPKSEEEIACDCEQDEKKPFMQTKPFLGIVTAFAMLMLAFPYYAHVFYPSNDKSEVVVVDESNIKNVTFSIDGMTCNGCASHIENDVNKLSGVNQVAASYENGLAKVKYDSTKVKSNEIKEAIKKTGYKVTKQLILDTYE